MKMKFGTLLMLTTLGTSSISYANTTATQSDGRADNKQERVADKTDAKVVTNFGTKEQKELESILGELTRQHNNASTLVKSNRESVSLATQSALVAPTPKAQKGLATAAIERTNDTLQNLTSVATHTISKFKQAGVASWYGRQFHGKKTASGERFDMNAMTAAHRSLPFGCYVKVTNKDNGQSVIVKINDRGPFHGNRVLDLSYGAAKAIGITKKGMGNVTIERIDDPKNAQIALNNQ